MITQANLANVDFDTLSDAAATMLFRDTQRCKLNKKHAGDVRAMYTCGCDSCFENLMYHDTEGILSESESTEVYINSQINLESSLLRRDLDIEEKLYIREIITLEYRIAADIEWVNLDTMEKGLSTQQRLYQEFLAEEARIEYLIR